MTGDYALMLDRIISTLSDTGFRLVDDRDYRAVLERVDGWRLILHGDKLAYPGFNLSVAPPGLGRGDEGLAVDILMEIYPPEMPDEVRPTLENQLRFLVRFGPTLFEKPMSDYLSAHDMINEGFAP